jgi:hypothetical protein
MSNEKPTAVERKQQSRDYVNAIETLRKAEKLTIEAAAKKAGKTVTGYYYHKRVAAGQKTKTGKTIKVKATRKYRRTNTLPVTTGFTELPANLRTSTTGNGKMLLAVAVGDGAEITKALETTLNRFFN